MSANASTIPVSKVRTEMHQSAVSKADSSPMYDITKRLFAGGVAGSVAKTCIAPLDRTKIIFQTSDKIFSYRNAAFEMMQILRNEGFFGLWRGNSATVIRVFPYAGIQFCAFDLYKKLFAHKDTGKLTSLQRLLAGSAAGATSVFFTYPLDLLRARLAVQRQWVRSGEQASGDSLRDAMMDEHGRMRIKELYRGLFPTLLGILPYAGIAFFTRDSLNTLAAQHYETTAAGTPLACKLAAGAVSALVAQSVTYPLDLVRRRMQTERSYARARARGDGGGPRQAAASGSVVGTLVAIYREEGGRGLFKGLSMNWIKGPVAFMISFTVFDYLKLALHIPPPPAEDFRRTPSRPGALAPGAPSPS